MKIHKQIINSLGVEGGVGETDANCKIWSVSGKLCNFDSFPHKIYE